MSTRFKHASLVYESAKYARKKFCKFFVTEELTNIKNASESEVKQKVNNSCRLGAATLVIMTFSLRTLGILIVSIMTPRMQILSVMTISTMTFSKTAFRF
jgi:hypothetical protein